MNIPQQQQAHRRFLDIYRESIATANVRVPFDNLDSGRKILDSRAECIRYIALYGGHHYHKLYKAYASTKFNLIKKVNVEIVDWGCGQALATCVLIDYFIEHDISLNVSSITLVEPSAIALQNGCEFVEQMFQGNSQICPSIRAISKSIDDVRSSDLISAQNNIKIHLFSNIIDVEGIGLPLLHQLITSSFRGVNRLICTSPNNESSHRLDAFLALFSRSHSTRDIIMSHEPIYENVFYAATGKDECRKISRYERQLTVELS